MIIIINTTKQMSTNDYYCDSCQTSKSSFNGRFHCNFCQKQGNNVDMCPVCWIRQAFPKTCDSVFHQYEQTNKLYTVSDINTDTFPSFGNENENNKPKDFDSKWLCPSCGSYPVPDLFCKDGGSRVCSNQLCKKTFHYCLKTGKFSHEIPLHCCYDLDKNQCNHNDPSLLSMNPIQISDMHNRFKCTICHKTIKKHVNSDKDFIQVYESIVIKK